MSIEETNQKRHEMQLDCSHLGEMIPAGQQQFKDEAKGIMVIITTLMCKSCALLLFDTQETAIKFRVNIIEKVNQSMEEQLKNDKN